MSLEQRPKVSVIVPVYRVEPFIEKCADSLLRQTLDSIQFIFVDDCGGDASVDLLRGVVGRYPERNVLIVSMPQNSGVSAARARGIALATGDYLGFCDSDDWVEPTMYERLYDAAIGQNADIVACGYNEIIGRKVTKFQFDKASDDLTTIMSFTRFGREYGALWNKIIRREFFLTENLHLGDGLSMWEDSCTLIPMRLRSAKTVFLPDCLYNYYVNEGSVTTRFLMRKVTDSCEAVRRLEQFFVSNGYASESKELIEFLKLNATEVLMRFPSRENIVMWRETFPEAASAIWRYPSWNIVLKFRAWLVARLPLPLAMIVVKYVRK